MATQDRITPVNLITATRVHRVPLQRLGLGLSKAPAWVAGVFDEQSLDVQFKTLNFLHTARWVSLGRFPRVSRDQRPERFTPRWVIFTSNFDGEWVPYYEAFMEVLSEGVYDIWGQSIGYPGFPAPRTANALRCWLMSRLAVSQHYYAAYPYARANDVRSAVRVRREVCSAALELQVRKIVGHADVTPIFDSLARRVRHCLGSIDPPGWSAPAKLADGSIGGVVTVFPVLPGHENVIKAAIDALPKGAGSPFRRVPGTHFARLALLDRDKVGIHPSKVITLRNSYLLFTADFDGVPPGRDSSERFFRSVHRTMPVEVQSVWRHCWGFNTADDADEFALLASRCRRPVFREFIDYPDESLRSVLKSLTSQRAFVELVRRRSLGNRIHAHELLAFLNHPPAG